MTNEVEVRDAVKRVVGEFAGGLRTRHLAQVDDPEGVLNKKIHNVFIAALGSDVQFWSAMSRSLDSAFGGMLERLGREIAERNFVVSDVMKGYVSSAQAQFIASLMEDYRAKRKHPRRSDYAELRALGLEGGKQERHYSDLYLIGRDGSYHLIELKAGGDLDNKKAASEKQAILNQYAILANSLPVGTEVNLWFATAYNKSGEGNYWRQTSVRQFFAEDELLIGGDFWRFVAQHPEGHSWVLEAFMEIAPALAESLSDIRNAYAARGNLDLSFAAEGIEIEIDRN